MSEKNFLWNILWRRDYNYYLKNKCRSSVSNIKWRSMEITNSLLLYDMKFETRLTCERPDDLKRILRLITESALSVWEKLFSISFMSAPPLLRFIVCKARNVVQEIGRVPDWNTNNHKSRKFVAIRCLSFTRSSNLSYGVTMFRVCATLHHMKKEKKKENKISNEFSHLIICYDRSENDKTQIIE